MDIVRKSFPYGEREMTLETGGLARQADGAVLVGFGDTRVLVTAVGRREAAERQSFFPLTVNYQERTYAAGKIPGGFFKREGRPSEKEVLTSRLIDRPLRPLFPQGFMNEVQVIATVLSLDPEVDPDVPALIGASAAVQLSGMPFNGPIGAARVGVIDGEYVLNPTFAQTRTQSSLDLMVAGTEQGVIMVESEAKELPEDEMLSAVVFGHEQMQAAIQAIRELGEAAGRPRWEWEPPAIDEALAAQVEQRFGEKIGEAYRIADKQARREQIDALREELAAAAAAEEQDEAELRRCFERLEKETVRGRILDGEPRIDGRDTRAVRPISARVGLLPRAHGSALFTRGETQALATATLGTERDSQIIDALEGESRDRFMLHYNFPPYCVGETAFMGAPKRREIGHGRLARRALSALLPNEIEFPYVLRVVSEVTESNGSSSMATVCGASLALMNAGVPLARPVAGIAMGLILRDKAFSVLSDILGDEDHLGDMDFKVAGTREGVTALQMDIKTEQVTPAIMRVALEQAREGRLHILGEMDKCLQAPSELSPYAPRLLTMQIKPAKIRDVIGKGGATIRSITDETGATIDIDDSGLVTIASTDKAAAERAKERIEELTADVEVGKIYHGTVSKIMDFGAFVTLFPGRDGLVHISQIAPERIERVRDRLNEGDQVKVKVLEVDKQGRVRLSMKAVVMV